MCKALYVASDDPIATTDRDEPASVFFVREIEGHQRRVRRQVSKPQVRHLGAHTGCSCGFTYEARYPSSMESEEGGRRSVDELRRFITRHVAGGRDIELYHCWEGDEDEPAERQVDVSPDHFGGESFRLLDKTLYRVRGAAQQRDEADER
jgi:hypothetical protein